MRIIYLHGFASSPQSSKARYFGARFAEHGIDFVVPQLDRDDFENLTLSGQLREVERAVAGRPTILMGSSLGGYLSAWYASRHAEITKVVLMAPAFHFAERWRKRMTEAEIAEWRASGFVPVFHYGARAERRLGYGFLEDSLQYEPEPNITQPALILHGTRDDVVPASLSEAYAAPRPNVQLRLYDSGHELTDVLDPMWSAVQDFLFQKV